MNNFRFIYRFFLLFFFVLFIGFSGCSKENKQTKDTKENKQNTNSKNEFGWKDGVSAADIPGFPLKGSIGGKEVQFQYVIFEKWRGSNDNVFVFSLVKPTQPCGYLEEFQGFQLINKGNAFNQGEWVKSKFDEDTKTYQSFFQIKGSDKSNVSWNCALVIESIDNKSVKGKIALFFNDDKKNWAAGKFEATVCNN